MILRFITRFLFPVINVARATQERLRQMQQQMNDMQQEQQKQKTAPEVKEGDYIDYEEVK